ncbi:MAG TPA: glycosyltransferase family 39 protein [Vicinamibacteria bacterium]|nr:glycosyltransferase family 39 protein [Vicinamibacteria bacterium]
MSAAPCWRAALAAAALALSVRAGLFVAASRVHADSFMAPDSYGYDALARTLLHDARFAAAPTGPPQTRRTPGFPLLIAATYAVAGEDPRAVVCVGIGISVLTVWLAAWVAGRLWGQRAAWIAGVLLALDIPSVTASRLFLTETPFAALLLAATAAAVGLLVRGRPRAWRGLLMGTLLASAALTRPIGLLLVIPVSLWLVACGRALRWSPRSTLWLLTAFALPWMLMVGGWHVRNRVAAGALVASDGPAKFVYLSRGSDILAQHDGTAVEVARAQLLQSLDDEVKRTGRPAERLYARAALALVARHPILFLKTQVRDLPELLLGTGATGLSLALDLADGPDRPRVWWWALNAGAALHLLVLYAGAACGLWRMRADEVPVRLLAVLLAGLVAYFVLLSTGPQAYSRFRVPFTPLLALAAARGLDLERRLRPR